MSTSDVGLVEKAQGGDRSAFEELVRRTSRLVFARLYLETSDTHRAEDLLQETFLRAYRSLGRLNHPGQFRAWLLTIAQNVLIDTLRQENRQKRAGPAADGHDFGNVPGRAPGPDDDAQQAEERQHVLAILRSLPEEYRLPLTLRYIAGADYETIEMQLGLSNGSLRGLLHRGLKMLRSRLETNHRASREA